VPERRWDFSSALKVDRFTLTKTASDLSPIPESHDGVIIFPAAHDPLTLPSILVPQIKHSKFQRFNALIKMKRTTMKHLLIAFLGLASLAGLTSCSEKVPAVSENSPANKEQAFLATFRQALEKNDSKTMDSLLLKEGTPAEVVEFYKMMMVVPEGTTIESVELVTPSAEAAAEYQQSMPMDGKNYKLPVTPTKQLVMIMKEKSANGSGSSKSSLPVVEKDGKFVIPLPVAVP
jgi:hypothetical protein